MNELETKLVNIAKRSVDEGEELVKEVKLLLEAESVEERATLSSIGLDFELKIASKRNEDLMIRQRGKILLEREVLSYNEIAELCTKYRLYMQPARNYRGSVPAELAAELNRYCKEKSITLPKSSDYSNFYIIAPPKMFAEYLSPGQVMKKAMSISADLAAERKRLRDEDPILVYRLDDSKEHYAIIKSWGNDFTPLRRVYGALTTPQALSWVRRLFYIFGIWAVAKVAATTWLSIAKFQSEKLNGMYLLATIATITVLVIGAVLLFSVNTTDFLREWRQIILRKQTK